MTKEEKIGKFIEDIEKIASSQDSDSKVIGLDFIALGGGDDNYFQDYLMHSKPIDDYLNKLNDFFEKNPSLLVTKLDYKIAKISVNNSKITSSDIKLIFKDIKVPNDDKFTSNYIEGQDDEYWKRWCIIISEFYPNCNSILFTKLRFGSLNQTTALFIYFNTDILSLDDSLKGWLKDKSNGFLLEEAVDFFVPRHLKKMEEQKIADLIQTTYSLGHNLKNRLLESDALMNSLLDDLEKSSLNISEKQNLKRYAKNVSIKVKSLSNTGKILDLIGRFMTERKWQEKWLSKGDYFFTEKFLKGELSHVSISGKYAKIKIENFPPKLKLKGWLGENSEYRPEDFIYEELFFELFVNILTYGKAYVEADKKYVDISISYEGSKIVIVNTPEKKIVENDKFKNLDKNIPIKPTLIGHGGLLYMYKFLTQTKIGDIDIILEEINNKFKIILELKGISNDE